MNGKYCVFSINTFNSIISSKVKISVEEPKSSHLIASHNYFRGPHSCKH